MKASWLILALVLAVLLLQSATGQSTSTSTPTPTRLRKPPPTPKAKKPKPPPTPKPTPTRAPKPTPTPTSTPIPLPASFDARVAWPKCQYIILDQMQCGSCWAFAAASAFADRLCIADVAPSGTVISPEPPVKCVPWGCEGGWMDDAHRFFIANGSATCTGSTPGACDQGCAPYESRIGTNEACPSQLTCEDGSNWNPNYTAVSEKWLDASETIIMQDLFRYGPVTVAFNVFENFYTFDARNQIYRVARGQYVGGHAVKLIGWGVEDGMKYWICANSWNTTWGNNGYFRVKRGSNLCGIETYAMSVYVKPGQSRSLDVEEGDDHGNRLLLSPPGAMVRHFDLESDFITNAANEAANLIGQLDSRRQAQGTPVVQSAFTSVVAGLNYDMALVLDGTVYNVLMHQSLQGTYSLTAPPVIVGTVGGSAGLSGGEIAAIVVSSVFGAALVVGAAVYAATRGWTSKEAMEGEAKVVEGEATVVDDPKAHAGIPVMNPNSHIRRVKAGEHQSVTARSAPVKEELKDVEETN